MKAALVILGALVTAAAAIPTLATLHRGEMTRSAFRTFGPGAPVSTLAAQIHQESGWRCDATSRVGALGCAQFMPATAADMASRYPSVCAPANPTSSRWAFRCRDLYMRDLMASTRSMGPSPLTECSLWWLALKHYNGGQGWTNRQRKAAMAAGADPNDPRALADFRAGRSPGNHRENTEYPERIFRIANSYAEGGWGRKVPCD